MTPETELKPKLLTIPEFAAKIKAKHPQYKDLPDDVLAAKVTHKYPAYESRVEPPFFTQGTLPNGQPGYVPDLSSGHWAPNVRIATQAETEQDIKDATKPPVSLESVIQSRLETVKQQRRQQEVQQRVARARTVAQPNSIYAQAQQRARTGQTIPSPYGRIHQATPEQAAAFEREAEVSAAQRDVSNSPFVMRVIGQQWPRLVGGVQQQVANLLENPAFMVPGADALRRR